MGAFLGPGIEWAIRPFAAREDVLQKAVAARPLEDQDAEAQIRWGKASTFGFKKGDYGIAPIVTVIYPEFPVDDDEEEEEEEPTEEWQEVDREETEEIRVENPDDEDQYVMVKDAQWVRFRRPDNTLVRLNFLPRED